MFHRGFCFVRLVMLLLLIGGAMAVGRGMFRSGYEQGFVAGMAFSAADGAVAPGSAAPPFAFHGRHSGFGPIGGGLVVASMIVFAMVVFVALTVMSMFGRRARHGWGHSQHGSWGRHHRPTDDIGPEKQPENYM